jgi:hypothetical protein
MAEVAIPSSLLADIPRRIAERRLPPQMALIASTMAVSSGADTGAS